MHGGPMVPTFRRCAAAAATTLALTTALTALTSTPAHTGAPVDAAQVPLPVATGPSEQDARRAFAELPLSFEANRGQVDRRARFLARGEDFTLFLTRRGALFDLHAPTSAAAVLLDPVGADPAPRIVGRRPQRATTSYFLGDDPSGWHRGVAAFDRARYRDLYPGIDLLFRGNRSGAEYDFLLAPGSDPDRIGYRLRGAERLRLADGNLVATTAAGDFVHHAPIAYQVIDGQRRAVAAAFHLDRGVVTFGLGSYDRDRPLVIDPETDLEYSTYLGGDSYDAGEAIVFEDGDAYLAGTGNSGFPTSVGAYGTTHSASDAFVTRISPDGAGAADLVYSTIIGGGSYDHGSDLAVDGGEVYLTGDTESFDFPTTSGAFDRSLYASDGGGTNTFFAKLSPDGAGPADLLYSTYLGGGYYTHGDAAIAVHDGDAYLAGGTDARVYPTTPGALHHKDDASVDIFLTRISPDGAGQADVRYGAIFGGPGDEGAVDIAFSRGDVYLTGTTYYKGFPTTRGGYDRSYNGEFDAFVVRVSPDGERRADLRYGTLLGTPADDVPTALAVRDGKVYLTGYTKSAKFPTSRRAYDRSYNGKGDAFLALLATQRGVRHDLKYSTFFGGGLGDVGYDVRVRSGEVYVVGTTASPALPTTKNAYDRSHNGQNDAFVAMFAPRGERRGDLDYSTFLGGPQNDAATALAVNGTLAYLTGSVGRDLPTTTGAFDESYNGGGEDAFVAVLRLPEVS